MDYEHVLISIIVSPCPGVNMTTRGIRDVESRWEKTLSLLTGRTRESRSQRSHGASDSVKWFEELKSEKESRSLRFSLRCT